MPGGPDPVDVAVVEVEDRVVGGGADQHVASDEYVHAVVEVWGAGCRHPAFDPVAEARCGRVPRRVVVVSLAECLLHLALVGKSGRGVEAAAKRPVDGSEGSVDVCGDLYAPA